MHSLLEDKRLAVLSEEQRAGFVAYATDPTHANWDALSQIYVGQGNVLDAVQERDPSFPDPYPLPADYVTDDFLQWPRLPDPAIVLDAMYSALPKR